MPVAIVIDELHLTVRVPDDLPGDRVEGVCRTLADAEFLDRLGRAVRGAFLARPELQVAVVSLAR